MTQSDLSADRKDDKSDSKNSASEGVALHPGATYKAMWLLLVLVVGGYVVALIGSAITGHFTLDLLLAGLAFAGGAGLLALGIWYYRMERILLVDDRGVRLFRGEHVRRALSWNRISLVSYGRKYIEYTQGYYLIFRKRHGLRGISVDTVHYTAWYPHFERVAEHALKKGREKGIPTRKTIVDQPSLAFVSPSARLDWNSSKSERKKQRKIFRQMDMRASLGEAALDVQILPPSWVERPRIRAFHRLAGPRNPSYLAVAAFFAVFAVMGFVLGKPLESSDTAFLVTFVVVLVGMFLLFHWGVVPALPLCSKKAYKTWFLVTMIPQVLALGFMFVSGFIWGISGFLTIGGAMMIGWAVACLVAFGVSTVRQCSFCGGVTPFRKGPHGWTCARCGTPLKDNGHQEP
jgi:hypothetical protein